MNDPLVSVVVCVYNGERFLEEALASLVAQDYSPYEIVFVDDGSSDRTAEIAKAVPGLRYHWQENAGVATARNTGIAAAAGDYIAFLDHDDVIPPSKLSLQVRHLVDHPEVGCVLGRQEVVVEPGVEVPEWLARDRVYGDLDGIPLNSAMIRAEALRAVGGFDPTYRLAEDRDLFVRLREHGVEIAVLPEVVVSRRFHGANKTYASGPTNHPLLRSLRAKIERERATGGTGS